MSKWVENDLWMRLVINFVSFDFGCAPQYIPGFQAKFWDFPQWPQVTDDVQLLTFSMTSLERHSCKNL